MAWALLAAIVIVTLAPAPMRPTTGGSANLERLGAFVALGLAFGLGYPVRLWRVFAALGLATVGLELMQELLPDRHGEVLDAIVKLAGAAGGFMLAWIATRLRWSGAG